MTTLYTNNFDSETTGALPAGWVNKTGTWTVQTLGPVSGAKAFGSSSNGDGDVALYEGATAVADMGVSLRMKQLTGNTVCALMGIILRSDAAGNNHYAILFSAMNDTGGSILLFKKVGGSYSQVGSAHPFAFSQTIGDTIYIRAAIVNSTITVFFGNGSLPASPNLTLTDTSITAAGYPGLYNGKDGSTVTMTIDDFVLDDAAAVAAATAITMTGPTTGSVGSPSTNFTVGANGSISGTVIVTPSDSSAGGTFSPTTVSINTASPTGTFTYTPASAGAKSISAANNGSLSSPSAITYTATSTAATAISVTGPSSGSSGSPSTNFTVSANGTISGTVVVTPGDSGAGGTFTPGTVSLTAGTPTKTFTYTPASTGAKTLTFTNNGGLTNQSNLTYTSSAGPVSIAVTDANWKWSPLNWDTNGGVKTAVNGGAYFRLGFTGSSVAIGIDVSSLTAGSVDPTWYPSIRYSVDSGPQTDLQLTSSTTQLSITGLAGGNHDIKVTYLAGWWENIGGTAPDRWTTPVYCLRITGATLANGATTVAPAWRTKKIAVFGDSIMEGIRANYGITQPGCQNAYESAPAFFAGALDAELGNVSWGGMNYAAGFNSIPAMNTSYTSYFSGRSRLSGGVFAEQPDYIHIELGANGAPAQSDVQTAITNMRTKAPAARIFVAVPVGGYGRSPITAAVAAYLAANTGETKVHLLDLGTSWQTGLSGFGAATEQAIDGLHPRSNWNARIGAARAAQMQAAIDGTAGPVLTTRTAALTLGDASGAAASLTGLSWTYQDTFNGAVLSSGTTGTTDGSGLFSQSVQTALASGGSGKIKIEGAAGVHYNGTVVVV